MLQRTHAELGLRIVTDKTIQQQAGHLSHVYVFKAYPDLITFLGLTQHALSFTNKEAYTLTKHEFIIRVCI